MLVSANLHIELLARALLIQLNTLPRSSLCWGGRVVVAGGSGESPFMPLKPITNGFQINMLYFNKVWFICVIFFFKVL